LHQVINFVVYYNWLIRDGQVNNRPRQKIVSLMQLLGCTASFFGGLSASFLGGKTTQ
jgi:hypothetical protein